MKLSFTSGQLIELLNCLNRFPGYTIHEESDYVYLVDKIENALDNNSTTLKLNDLNDVINLYNVVFNYENPEIQNLDDAEWEKSDYATACEVLHNVLAEKLPSSEVPLLSNQ